MRKSLLKNLPFLVGGVISACVMTSCSDGNKQQVMEEKEYVYVGQGNPYLPLWEHVPDGEPKVFEDPDCPGKFRVYVYGSHDNGYKCNDIDAHTMQSPKSPNHHSKSQDYSFHPGRDDKHLPAY